jgi:hypothetical protein
MVAGQHEIGWSKQLRNDLWSYQLITPGADAVATCAMGPSALVDQWLTNDVPDH